MCLLIRKKKVRVHRALWNITAYKILVPSTSYDPNSDDSGYMTPFYSMHVKFGELYEQDDKDKLDYFTWKKGKKTFHELDEGVYHLYKWKKDAKDDIENYDYPEGSIVVKAIIPRGTKYVNGWYGWARAFGAKSVIYTADHSYYQPSTR